ncbi:MAG: hypothetical protein GVY26_20775 [Bacteroidetes bacterium]|jgi:site-specific recombinase|nr:hypothetical protein [Bacteroidota bacterium]
MTTEDQYRTPLQELLARMQNDGTDRQPLIELVQWLRPSSASKPEKAAEKLDLLIYTIQDDPQHRATLRDYIYRLFESRNSIRAFTELGVQSFRGFFSESWRKMSYKFLPPAYPENGLMQDLYYVFRKRKDYRWVEHIPAAKWAELFATLGYREPHTLPPGHPALLQLLNCILVLSQRITAIGLEPEIVGKMPEIELFDSPFMVQSREISEYLKHFDEPDFERTTENDDYRHITVMLAQCEDYIQRIRKGKSKFGTSLSLSQSIIRLTQNIERLRIFLKLIHATPEPAFKDEAHFFQQLIRAENKKYSLRQHFNQNLSYLAFQITEHTGKKGEYYITSTRSEYWKMFRSALGGGFIVGFLAIIKTVISSQALSLFNRAFQYSMNYSLGFILIQFTHSTLATKQPAMTASKVAAALDISKVREENMKNLVEMIVRLWRTQTVAFAGNILFAFPVAYAVAWGIEYASGAPFASGSKVEKIIHDLHPVDSLALFHAAIAGVFLFLAGLISGYYDNRNVYSKIPRRIREHRRLQRIFSPRRLDGIATYVENNLGALAGNFFLGIFLGSMGPIGYFLGLPLDIRHVTFASGNFGIALAGMEPPFDTAVILWSLLGIALIGLINFIVSYGLTTAMAMKSRNVDFKGTRLLLRLLLQRFFSRPQDFFWAPKDQPPPETDEGAMKPLNDGTDDGPEEGQNRAGEQAGK